MKLNFRLKLFGITILKIEIDKTYDNDRNIETKEIVKEIKTTELPPRVTSGGNIRPDLKEIEIKAGLREPKVKEIKTKCTSCSGTTYESDLGYCDSCGSFICSGCSSQDMHSQKRYCNNCWEEGKGDNTIL